MKKTVLVFAMAVGVLPFITGPMACAQTPMWTKTDKSDPLHQISFKEFSLD